MAKKIRQVFILGAGLGTRLRPLTDTVPKVMVPITPGKPLLEHTIELLRDQGIGDFIINLHYLPEVITSYFGDGKKYGVRIRYSDETTQLLETGGALKRAGNLLDENFLFLYGDELHFFDFSIVADLHLQKASLATIVLKDAGNPGDGEIVEFDPVTSRVLRWYVRPHGITELNSTRSVNAGLYVLSKRILDYIPVGVSIKFDGQIIPAALAAGEEIYAFPAKEPILDIGKPEKYEQAKKYYTRRTQKNS